MATPSAQGTDDAADTAVRLYGRLVLALRQLETAETDHGLASDDGAALAARIRELCAELEQLLDACEEQPDAAEWIFQRIRVVEREVASVVRCLRSLIERGRVDRLDSGRQ
jgi:HPt (histidine-containing phosphotransfer) domain-containing protein